MTNIAHRDADPYVPDPRQAASGRRLTGGVTAALAVAALVGGGLAVGTATSGDTSTTAATASSDTSGTSSSASDSSDSSSTVSSSGQSAVASTNGS